MKPLIVGEQPSKTGDPNKPIEGRIGARLAIYAGLTLTEFLETFERKNLLHERAETNGKGSVFNDNLASYNATLMRHYEFAPNRIILVLGKRAAKALGIKTDYFVEQHVDDANVWVVPHPSGVNRWWNDGNNARQMWQFMHAIMMMVRT